MEETASGALHGYHVKTIVAISILINRIIRQAFTWYGWAYNFNTIIFFKMLRC
ncbi:hypothetical protein ECO26H__480004 [Escherichia coli O26:H11]|nr:hypothetical protein ECO26H__480004 [Escherichia coli O26:H11]